MQMIQLVIVLVYLQERATAVLTFNFLQQHFSFINSISNVVVHSFLNVSAGLKHCSKHTHTHTHSQKALRKQVRKGNKV